MTRSFGDFNRAFERDILSYGPWSGGCKTHTERVAQLRSLAALSAVYVGSDHPIVAMLRAAEHDAMAFTAAQEAFEGLPPLRRRQILSTFSIVTFRKAAA